MLNVTEKASQRLAAFQKTNTDPSKTYFRISVETGGCSGLSYAFNFDQKKENDHLFRFADVEVVVDPTSMMFLTGSTVDYLDELAGSRLVVKNPHAKSECGCGSSFAA